MNSFAASPEFAPDTLFLYLEPDLVTTIMHSILEAVEIHNREIGVRGDLPGVRES